VYAVAAAVVTWVLSTHFLTTTAPIVKLLVGGTLLGALYVALLGVTSIRHSFVVAEKH
jgi:Na+-translocating ferredoxin:NAD+ oxidoreductase RnfD subunit